MTHTLHRSASKPDLPSDYIVLTMSAKGINDAGSEEAMREFLRIACRFAPVNMGDMRSGNLFTESPQEIEASIRDTSIVHAVFVDSESVVAVLNVLKAAALGLSVTVTGDLREIDKICHRLEWPQAPHTVAYSLGVWGKRELLPPPAIFDICSLCGHSLVSPRLVQLIVNEVGKGLYTAEEGAIKLAQPCVCGLFNVPRAAACLGRLVGEIEQSTAEAQST
jgi:hypothetical protein